MPVLSVAFMGWLPSAGSGASAGRTELTYHRPAVWPHE
ncbi:hypothetical protein I547_1314 [Mycobacterium kansasii 824]|nr:hypothetical protein I547_1314 [Mycobacterium kansasii 824]